MSRLYVGRLSERATERDLEHFFRGYGRIRELVMKRGFAFVEFEDYRDAEDAVYDLNGKELNGDRISLEMARRDPRGRESYGGRGGGGRDGGYGGGRDGGGYRGRSPPRGGRNNRFSPPHQTRYRLLIENLSTRYTWQELKDMFRAGGLEVTFADAHRTHQNEGIVCFKTSDDLKKAIEKFDGKDINGRKIKLVDDSRPSHSRSRSPRGRKDSRSRSPRSKSKSRSRSRSADSAGARGSASPARNGDDDGKAKEKRSPSVESRSRSATPAD